MSVRRERATVSGCGDAGERGFALLTVIFFVLALTILGLSLFSLSNFEAGFFRPAVQRAEAIQAARSGADWARWVIENTDHLDDVRTASPPPYPRTVQNGRPFLVGALARRGDDFDSADSTGFVFQDPGHVPGTQYEPVWVRAVTASGGQEQAVLAKFQPVDGTNLYKRLITATDRLILNRATFDNTGQLRIQNLNLHGEVAVGPGGIIDERDVAYSNLSEIPYYGSNWCPVPANGLPGPEIDVNPSSEWWQTRWAESTLLSAGPHVSLSSGGNDHAVFRTEETQSDGRLWSVGPTPPVQEITVSGTCLWMLPFGMRTGKQLEINGNGTLILVAGYDPTFHGSIEDGVGWALFGGVNVTGNVRVFIISSGGVELEQWEDAYNTTDSAPYLSVYARFVHIQPPYVSGTLTDYRHGNSCGVVPNEDRFGQLVDKLVEKDLLPNSRFCRHRLVLTAGSWQESAVDAGN